MSDPFSSPITKPLRPPAAQIKNYLFPLLTTGAVLPGPSALTNRLPPSAPGVQPVLPLQMSVYRVSSLPCPLSSTSSPLVYGRPSAAANYGEIPRLTAVYAGEWRGQHLIIGQKNCRGKRKNSTIAKIGKRVHPVFWLIFSSKHGRGRFLPKPFPAALLVPSLLFSSLPPSEHRDQPAVSRRLPLGGGGSPPFSFLAP